MSRQSIAQFAASPTERWRSILLTRRCLSTPKIELAFAGPFAAEIVGHKIVVQIGERRHVRRPFKRRRAPRMRAKRNASRIEAQKIACKLVIIGENLKTSLTTRVKATTMALEPALVASCTHRPNSRRNHSSKLGPRPSICKRRMREAERNP